MVKDTQPEQWKKFCTLHPSAPEQKFLKRVGEQINKADPLATNQTMRACGTLGVPSHEERDRGRRFFLCQFKLEHDLNPDTLAGSVHLEPLAGMAWKLAAIPSICLTSKAVSRLTRCQIENECI